MKRLRSMQVTQGAEKAPNGQCIMRWVIKKPILINLWLVWRMPTQLLPCNSGLQKLADSAEKGIKTSGGNCQSFGTPTVSDGISMGTENEILTDFRK